MKPIYIHDTLVHNTNAAEQIVPEIINKFHPKSVVDVGCGIGTWLDVFQKYGVTDFIGIDGDFLDRKLLMIDESKFVVADLTKSINLNRRFDLAISTEVAEHLPESSANNFINLLTNLSDTIFFSAAIPGQGGQNHLNEQYPVYWQKKFEDHNYTLVYDFSPEIWNNNQVEWWYKQNIFIYQKKELSNSKIEMKFYVHPELYSKKLNEIDELKLKNQNIYKGRIPVSDGFKIFIKSILNLNRLDK